jgi:aryl-alcohol dehydrogenase-like predicted oxidoreductase
MKYKLLGRSGLRVSELCLGTMTFGEDWGWGASKEESRRIFDKFLESGGNFIDTANRYTEGTSEKYVGEFISSNRDYFVLATKYTLISNPDDPNASGNHRKNMMRSVEDSLKRLNTDYIDLLWLHAWDFTTPVDEVMRGLDDLVRAGKVHYIGISDTPAWIVSQANTLAELRGWSRFVALQIQYSLVERSVERDLLPMAKAFDMAVTPWAILGSGFLTGKYSGKTDEPRRLKDGSARLSRRNFTIANKLGKLAARIGRTPSQTAINWVRQKDRQIIPILGARNLKQLEDNLGCLEFELTPAQMKSLDDASAIELGFPHDFLKQDHIKWIVYGDHHDKIENHRL